MEFREANKLLYRGYLYSLILAIVAIAAVIVTVLAAFLPLTNSPSALAPAVALLAGEVVAFIIAGVLIFFLYLFRGYMALHRIGIGWAWWMAWGPIIEAVLGIATIVVLALAALTHAQSIDRGPITGERIWSILAPALVMLIILGAFGIFLTIAHILFLSNMYRHTGIGKFHTAYILLIIGLVLSIIPYIGILGAIVLLVQYVVEMLAYKEASEWTPPAPQTPQPQTSTPPRPL
ncbi:hypothetical protein ODS41_07365 [Pyrobaculum sp. 3827-6]|uniref:hypothetical protein n=1 Tax=Pyrobaculum sp. 3827-6 TaxID=2983604 RepID=UPI0021D831AA|nr:hypothetical protein [Pyrobaculum sp. 3827-6]MCU7787731.1 hypothetical protein [Pyrobaculum sp. 3827-6]